MLHNNMQLKYCILAMDKVFKALADSTRRRLLDCLYTEQGLTLSQLVAETDMTRQSATRHINVLEDAGLVVTVWEGREKLHYLNPVPLAEINHRWIDKFSKDRTKAVLALKKALEE